MRSEPSPFLFYSVPFIIFKSLFPETDFLHFVILFVFLSFLFLQAMFVFVSLSIFHFLISFHLVCSIASYQKNTKLTRIKQVDILGGYSFYLQLCFSQTSLLYIGTLAGYCKINIALNSFQVNQEQVPGNTLQQLRLRQQLKTISFFDNSLYLVYASVTNRDLLREARIRTRFKTFRFYIYLYKSFTAVKSRLRFCTIITSIYCHVHKLHAAIFQKSPSDFK